VAEPYTDVDADSYAAPNGYVDTQCAYHDLCYFECRLLEPCDKHERRRCDRDCDHHLLHGIFTNIKGVISPWGWVVGGGIALDFWPPAGKNGGPKGHQVSCCGH
jgi:hypothetical protein